MSNTVNIKRIVDVSTAVSVVTAGRRDFRNALFIFQGAQVGTGRVNLVTSLEEAVNLAGSNSEVAKAAQTFFAGGFNGIKPTNLYIANFDDGDETWADVITELLADSRFYWIAVDSNFDTAEKLELAAAVEASTSIKHFAMLDDTTAAACTQDVETDTTSLIAKLFSYKYTHTAGIYSDATQASEYHAMAAISYFATVDFTAARKLGSLAHKQFSGITATVFTGATTPTAGYDNVVAKNGSVYINAGEQGRTVMEKGNAADGKDIAFTYAADYLDYQITYNIFDLLVRIPALTFTSEGKAMLYSAIASAFEELKAAGVIAGGTDPDTGVEYLNGYAIDIPLNISSANKAQGLWNGIVCIGLLAGYAKKIVVTNTLKL